jgi:hypothetical protein
MPSSKHARCARAPDGTGQSRRFQTPPSGSLDENVEIRADGSKIDPDFLIRNLH